MLRTLEIVKLFGRFDYRISFSKENIMIITGPNGYGKSTILRIINSFSNEGLDRVLSYPYEKLMIFSDNIGLEITKGDKRIKIGKYEFDYSAEDYRNELRYLSIAKQLEEDDFPDDSSNGIISFAQRMFPRWLFTEKYQKDLLFALRVIRSKDRAEEKNYFFACLQQSIDLVLEMRNDIGKVHFIQEQRLIEKKIVSDDIQERREPKQEYVKVIEENSIKLQKELAEIMKRHSSVSSNLDSTYIERLLETDDVEGAFEDTLEQLTVLQMKHEKLQKYGLASAHNATYISNMDKDKLKRFGIEISIYLKDANEKYRVFESIIEKLDLYEKIVNEKLMFKRIRLSSSEGIVVMTDENAKLALSELSSGEQEILVLFYKLIFESDVNLLMIDEPEISLHIAWQKELMENIRSVVALKRDIRVIIATHSPQILSYNWDYQVDLGGQQDG